VGIIVVLANERILRRDGGGAKKSPCGEVKTGRDLGNHIEGGKLFGTGDLFVGPARGAQREV